MCRAAEITASLEYLKQSEPDTTELLSSQRAWQDLAHSIFNFKEFLYLQ